MNNAARQAAADCRKRLGRPQHAKRSRKSRHPLETQARPFREARAATPPVRVDEHTTFRAPLEHATARSVTPPRHGNPTSSTAWSLTFTGTNINRHQRSMFARRSGSGNQLSPAIFGSHNITLASLTRERFRLQSHHGSRILQRSAVTVAPCRVSSLTAGSSNTTKFHAVIDEEHFQV